VTRSHDYVVSTIGCGTGPFWSARLLKSSRAAFFPSEQLHGLNPAN
jgi:hypothetical protein